MSPARTFSVIGRIAARPTIVRMSTPTAAEPIDEQVSYDERGLVPCVVQSWSTGEVLTLAYMNAAALARTRATGELHLYSRSRDELWHKGATSGNFQAVKALRLDCDRSEERRVGKEGRSRWSPDHLKKKRKKKRM